VNPAGNSTRIYASSDATAGARADGANREAALPWSRLRAPAVATAVLVAALCFVPVALADDTTPPTPPATTTPDAPPPDPYHPPAPTPKPKSSAPSRSAPVVHSAPAVRTPSYSPPVTPTPVTPSRSTPIHKAKHVRAKKVARKRVVDRRAAAPKPVKVTFAPFANLAATAEISLSAESGGNRDRYLWLAGLAFAVLAVAGLSLQLLSTRFFQVEGGVR
jgi:hypothetical protein